jgi:hypothetical protein
MNDDWQREDVPLLPSSLHQISGNGITQLHQLSESNITKDKSRSTGVSAPRAGFFTDSDSMQS